MDKNDDIEESTVPGYLLTEILYEDSSSMTYRLYEIDSPENNDIISCIGTFNIRYKKGMNKKEKKELLNSKIDENSVFRNKFQQKIDETFSSIVKSF